MQKLLSLTMRHKVTVCTNSVLTFTAPHPFAFHGACSAHQLPAPPSSSSLARSYPMGFHWDWTSFPYQGPDPCPPDAGVPLAYGTPLPPAAVPRHHSAPDSCHSSCHSSEGL